MDAYYSGYYTENCHPERFTWFDSWKYPATVSHVISAILVPLNVFGGYCILFQSTEKMWRVKWPMFNLHLWTSVLDVLMSLLVTPYIFPPLLCGFSAGLLNFLPDLLLMFLIQSGISFVHASMVVLFENRHSAVVMDTWKIEKTGTRIGLYAFNYAFGTFIMIPIYFKVPDQETAKLKMLRQVACPSPEFFDTRTFALLDMDDMELIQMLASVHLAFFSLQILFFFLRTVHFLVVKNPSLSENTRRLQRRTFLGICIQVAIPIVILVIPMLYMGYTATFNYYNQALTNTLTILFSFHGIFSTLAILVIYEPYRKFSQSLIYRSLGIKKVSRVEEHPKHPKQSVTSVAIIE